MVAKAISPQAPEEQKPIGDRSIVSPPLKKKFTDLVKIIPSQDIEEPVRSSNILLPFDHYAIIESRIATDNRSHDQTTDEERRNDIEAREESRDDATRDDGFSFGFTGDLSTASTEESTINYEAKTGYSHEVPRSLFSFFFGSGGTNDEELNDVSSGSTIGTMELKGEEAKCGPSGVQERSARLASFDSAIGKENEGVWHAHIEIFRQAMKTDIPVTTYERFQQDSIQCPRKITKLTGSLVEVAAEEAFWNPEQKIPLGRRHELSRQKAAVRQIIREEEDKKAKESNFHNEPVLNRYVVSDLCFVNEMYIPTRNVFELARNFCVVVFTLGKYGRMEGEIISQLHGQEQSTSDQSKLNESEPKAFKQLLTQRLCSRPSFRPKQVPNQSHVGQAVRDLCFMASSRRLVQFEDSLLFETLSPKSSARINILMEQGLLVPGSAQRDPEKSTETDGSAQRDPKESTKTDMAAKEQMHETCPFDEESNAEPSSDSRQNQAKKGKESTTAVKKKLILFSRSRLRRLIGARPRKKEPRMKGK